MVRSTKQENLSGETPSAAHPSQTSGACCTPKTSGCSTGKGCIAFLIVVCTLLNIGANWYFFTEGGKKASDFNTVAEALKQIQYDQAGGKEIYDLYMEMQKLQAESTKSELKAKVDSLKKNAGQTDSGSNSDTQTAPTAAKKMNDAQYAGVFKDSYVEGSKDAKITLIEYSDLECPYCIMQKKNGTMAALKKKYGDSVNIIFKPLNLARHPGADQKGWASLCVAKLGGAEKYSKFYNAIFDKSEIQGPVFALDNLSALAKEVGVDQKKFDTCYTGKETEAQYKSYTTESSAFNVNGTPTTLVLNNETKEYEFVRGAAPASNFESVIDGLLK